MEKLRMQLKNAKQTKRKCCKIKEKTKKQSKQAKVRTLLKNNQKQFLKRKENY